MKTLARYGDWELSKDDRTFVVQKVLVVPETGRGGKTNKMAGIERRVEFHYFGRLDHAVQCMADRVGEQEATTLREFLRSYKAASTDIIKQLASQRAEEEAAR